MIADGPLFATPLVLHVDPVAAARSLVIEAFIDVPVLVKLWKQDAEFGPDANMYFDSSIKNIFCTEDIVVLAQMVASQL